MKKIEQYLNLASRAYYSGNPIIPDEVFDRLADSIGYNKVGAKQHDNIEKHYRRMYSLDKFYEGEGRKPLESIPDNRKVRTPKLDGAAISILYIDGQLTRVLTRGDGIEGTDITDKFINSNRIPTNISVDRVLLQVTGEIVAPKQIENARNYAAGSLNLNSVEEFSTRAVEFYAYGVSEYLTDTFTKDMQALEAMGFNTVLANDLHNIYPTDGIVVRIDNNKLFEEQGYTSKFPKGAYAVKERGAAVETKILSVEWQVGKSGKVTPVAILEPITIEDAIISRATLNNVDFIKSLDIQIGDTVGVIRAGGVIPCITHKVDA